MLSRRQFLELLGVAAVAPSACISRPRAHGIVVNDIHSQLNATRVDAVVTPRSIEELAGILRDTSGAICTAGGRHAMGGQQFAAGTTLIDVRQMNHVLSFDRDTGILEVESGIQWPELIAYTAADGRWGIAQKQTGADRLTLGGSLSANIHGRGLTMKPIIGDVESFSMVDGDGVLVACSREKNRELFALAIGGYGLFGTIASIRLRLVPRRKVQRIVEVQTAGRLLTAFESRIAEGFTYGDFQFSINERSEKFLREGVFSCYRPVPGDTPMPETQAELRPEDWLGLLTLAHADKEEAYRRYVDYYLSTSGQIYWSDEHQLSYYPDDYHRALDTQLRLPRGTEMITEIYVPRPQLAEFLEAAAEELRRRSAGVVYGTVRLIEKDDESYLPWAREAFACVIFNLHAGHAEAALAESAGAFRALIDLAIERRGSYYLTYHRWARRDQVEACHPRFASFLREKRRIDPRLRFTSEWYRHYAAMFGS